VAADLTSPTSEVMPAPAPAMPSPSAPRPHRIRFAIIYGALGAILVAAIVGVAIFATRSINPAPKWSAWKPSGGGLGAAKQIAQHVGATYRLPSGLQLVDVLAKEPAVAAGAQQVPVHYLDLRAQKGTSGDTIVQMSPSNSLTYSMCGAGASCAIATGKPSVERGTLVRREILELALYTFKYVGSIDHVIAFMPPKVGTRPTIAIYLQKGDLSEELKHPLARTLSAAVPHLTTIGVREQQTIDSLLNPRTYTFSLAQSQQGDAILVLKPAA
jgi:hypothetical protein